ncbi:hypothetical protein P691DRAFT_801396 [Macrolepiota fuliginosa MF-IS2]|uniref:Uncharacterized protein n=1 Tax=Macrolepiota fuliginosa MF-IS2 TaxID=1400762 RepID=A0A9P5XAY0_9AGAR|nr:hypothetical protein P691DRAFT_801396 [Macrolepiota fuliginosa MF-IS2]
MAVQEDAAYNDGQSQNGSSQEYMPPPSNQLQCDPTPKIRIPLAVPAAGNPKSYKDKALEEILSQFVPFDTTKNLSRPFEEENECDKTFLQDSAIELMELMLETWAWNMSRIAHTTQKEGERLGEHLKTTIDTEKEQDTMCARLQEFVLRMRSAIDALRGI